MCVIIVGQKQPDRKNGKLRMGNGRKVVPRRYKDYPINSGGRCMNRRSCNPAAQGFAQEIERSSKLLRRKQYCFVGICSQMTFLPNTPFRPPYIGYSASITRYPRSPSTFT